MAEVVQETTKQKSTTFIGKCNFRGNQRIFGMKQKDRRQHTYVIGQTGTGKTTLLENMVLQDIYAGHGVAIVDPHGEFVERILEQIPSNRANDVIYFNPVDSEFPIGFNVLEVPDVQYKHLIVSDLLGIFTKIWANVWSARMEYILQNCILALIDTPGTTLLGIPRLLVDKDYRQKIVANVKDPVVKSFWVHEYETWRDQFRNEAIVPIQNKVNQFINTSFIRNIVGQPKSTLNVKDVMNGEKILLVNVSKGRVGEDNSALLGAMIITKIQLAAMERVRIPEDERRDFYLYVDEFQNFATDSFASILSEARKYRLNLIIAHQYIGQLVTDVSTKVRDAVFGNVGTKICFRVGAPDAEYLETEFAPEFMPQDLINLPNHTIYLRLMVGGVTSRPFSAATLPPLKFETDPTVKDHVIKVSREHYARPRAEVEEKISRWSGIGAEGALEGGSFTGGSGAVPSGTLIETPCWNCGKTATVPFKPDGKRPVYCMSCLKQIEEGKLIPLPERMPQLGPRTKFSQSLENLGIEFEMQPQQSSAQGRTATEDRPQQSQVRRDRNQQMPRREDRRDFRSSGGGPLPSRSVYQGSQGSGQNSNRDQRDPRFSGRDNRILRPEDRRLQPSHMRSRPVVRVPHNVRPVSLADLKNKNAADEKNDSKEQKNQKPMDKTSALRRALDEALKSKLENVIPIPAAAKEISETKLETPAGKNQNLQNENGSGGNLKPGDIVRF